MKLKELKLWGFKSFAGATEIFFDQSKSGLTAVIGPNGSGKSNVADAIRWVLGEQSQKSLRSKASTDVIFAGSKARKRANVARVELTFDNESGRFPVEAAEVTLRREADRSGSSEYFINGESVRLQDVILMLTEAGVGPKSYAVISQGMVGQYLTSTPAERRELFDEATGVKPMQIKLGKAERTLGRAEEKVRELAAILQELKPRLVVLERQAKAWQEREHLVVEYDKLQSSWYVQEWEKIAVELLAAESKEEAAAATVAQARAAREKIETDLLTAAEVKPEPVVFAQKNLPVVDVHELLVKCQQVVKNLMGGQEPEQDLSQLQQELDQAVDLYEARRKKEEAPPKAAQSNMREQMSNVRDQELAAERAHGLAQAAVAQAAQKRADLLTEIKRERGSEWSEKIERGGLGVSEDKISYNQLRQVEDKLAAVGEIDPLIIKEYEEVQERHADLQQQLTDAEATVANSQKLIQELKKDIKSQFGSQLKEINKYFKEFFKNLFNGGEVNLAISEEGVELDVNPPDKKLHQVQALSGGEKALTSLALLLAIVKVQQPPFLVMDEVDAALDEANSERFVNAVHELATETQVIIITHNRATMAEAGVLYGVTMNQDAVSEVYSVHLDTVMAKD